MRGWNAKKSLQINAVPTVPTFLPILKGIGKIHSVLIGVLIRFPIGVGKMRRRLEQGAKMARNTRKSLGKNRSSLGWNTLRGWNTK